MTALNDSTLFDDATREELELDAENQYYETHNRDMRSMSSYSSPTVSPQQVEIIDVPDSYVTYKSPDISEDEENVMATQVAQPAMLDPDGNLLPKWGLRQASQEPQRPQPRKWMSSIENEELRDSLQIITHHQQPQVDLRQHVATNSHNTLNVKRKLASHKGNMVTSLPRRVVLPHVVLYDQVEDELGDVDEVGQMSQQQRGNYNVELTSSAAAAAAASAAMVATQPYLQMQHQLEGQVHQLQQKLQELEQVADACSGALELIPTKDETATVHRRRRGARESLLLQALANEGDALRRQQEVDEGESMELRGLTDIERLQRRQLAIEDRLLALTDQLHARQVAHDRNHGVRNEVRMSSPSISGLSKETPLESHTDLLYADDATSVVATSSAFPTAKPVSLATPTQLKNTQQRKVQSSINKRGKNIKGPQRGVKQPLPKKGTTRSDLPSTAPLNNNNNGISLADSPPVPALSSVSASNTLEHLNMEIEALRGEFRTQLDDIRRMFDQQLPGNIFPSTQSRLPDAASSSSQAKHSSAVSTSLPGPAASSVHSQGPAQEFPLDKQFAAYQPCTALDNLLNPPSLMNAPGVDSLLQQSGGIVHGGPRYAGDWEDSATPRSALGGGSRLKLGEAESVLHHVRKRRAILESNLAIIERTKEGQALHSIIGLMQRDENGSERARIKALVDDAIKSAEPRVKLESERQWAAEKRRLQEAHQRQVSTTASGASVQKRIGMVRRPASRNESSASALTKGKKAFSAVGRRVDAGSRVPRVAAREPSPASGPHSASSNRRRLDLTRTPYMHLLNDMKTAKPHINSITATGDRLPVRFTYLTSATNSHSVTGQGSRETPTKHEPLGNKRVYFQGSHFNEADELRELSTISELTSTSIQPLSIRQYSLATDTTQAPTSSSRRSKGEGKSLENEDEDSLTEDGHGVSVDGEGLNPQQFARRKFENDLMDILLHQTRLGSADNFGKKTTPLHDNFGELQREVDEELMEHLGRLWRERRTHEYPPGSPEDRVPTPLPSTQWQPPLQPQPQPPSQPLPQQRSVDESSEVVYSDDFSEEHVLVRQPSPLAPGRPEEEEESLYHSGNDLSTPEATKMSPAPQLFEECAVQTEVVKSPPPVSPAKVSPEVVQEESVTRTESLVSIPDSLASSSLDAAVSDTQADSFSEGVCLLADRSQGQEADIVVDPVVRERLGPLPSMLVMNTISFEDDESLRHSDGQFVASPILKAQPTGGRAVPGDADDSGSGRERIPVCDHTRPIPAVTDPYLVVLATKFGEPCTKVDHSAIHSLAHSMEDDDDDTPSEASLKHIYERSKQLKRARRMKEPTPKEVHSVKSKPTSSTSYQGPSFGGAFQTSSRARSGPTEIQTSGDRSEGEALPQLTLKEVRRRESDLSEMGDMDLNSHRSTSQQPRRVIAPTPVNHIRRISSADAIDELEELPAVGESGGFTMTATRQSHPSEEGNLSTQQIIQEAFMKTGGTSADWADETGTAGTGSMNLRQSADPQVATGSSNVYSSYSSTES